VVKIASVTRILQESGFELDYTSNGSWNSPEFEELYKFLKYNHPTHLELFLNLSARTPHFWISSVKVKNFLKSFEKSKTREDAINKIGRWYKSLKEEHSKRIYFVSEIKELKKTLMQIESSRGSADSLLLDRIEDIISNSEPKEIQELLNTIIKWNRRVKKSRKVHLFEEESGRTLYICPTCGKLGEGRWICLHGKPKPAKPFRLYAFREPLNWLILNTPEMVLEIFVYHTLKEVKMFRLINNLRLQKKENKEDVGEIDLIVNDMLVCVISKNLSSESEKKQIQFLINLSIPFITIGPKAPQIKDHGEYYGHFSYKDKNFSEKLIEEISKVCSKISVRNGH